MFDDMIADVDSNLKLSPKPQYSTCFHITILFQSVQNYKTKCSTLFYHKKFLTKKSFNK